MSTSTLNDLLIEEMQDIYHAEQQLVKALPKMAKAAADLQLRASFQQHLVQTEEHVRRLEKAFRLLGEKPKAKVCPAMKGLVTESSEIIKEDMPDAIKDAALIGAAQKVEHYEIASYGTIRTYADLLGRDDVSKILQATLDEEGATDQKLTNLAGSLNMEALAQVEDD